MNVELLSLASATAPAATRVQMIHNAAAAGFDAVGLRVDTDPPDARELSEIAAALWGTGLVLLDIEVVRLGTHDDATIRSVVDAVAALGARHVLAVSDLPDPSATAHALADLSAQLRPTGARVVLEFMAFTAVRTLADAVAMVEATGDDSIGVLVDALHLRRTGGSPALLDRIDPSRLPYIQLCDAPFAHPDGGVDGMIHEARHSRLQPGLGELPLADLVRRAPAVPISVEVHDVAARARHSPAELARLVAQQTRAWLAAQGSIDQPSSTG